MLSPIPITPVAWLVQASQFFKQAHSNRLVNQLRQQGCRHAYVQHITSALKHDAGNGMLPRNMTSKSFVSVISINTCCYTSLVFETFKTKTNKLTLEQLGINYAWKTCRSCLCASFMKQSNNSNAHGNTTSIPGFWRNVACSLVSITMLVIAPPGANILSAASASSQTTETLLPDIWSAVITSAEPSRHV